MSVDFRFNAAVLAAVVRLFYGVLYQNVDGLSVGHICGGLCELNAGGTKWDLHNRLLLLYRK